MSDAELTPDERIAWVGGETLLGVRTSDRDVAAAHVHEITMAALTYYKRTSHRPAIIRIPLEWTGALYRDANERAPYRDVPIPIRVTLMMEGDTIYDLVQFPHHTPVGYVTIEATPGLTAPQVYGAAR